MISCINNKNGSAVCIALVLSVVMLVMALAYAKLTTGTQKATAHVDEQVRLKYLADGVSQVALLKFKLYPTDFYVAWEAANNGGSSQSEPLQHFNHAPEFENEAFLNDQVSAFAVDGQPLSNEKITIDFQGYELLTFDRANNEIQNKWKSDVVSIKTVAKYRPQSSEGEISATSVLTVKTSHFMPNAPDINN